MLLLLVLISPTAIVASGGSESAITTTKEYAAYMNHTPTPGPGCWQSNYPNTTWLSVTCSQPNYPAPTVGDGTDDYAKYSGTSNVGWAEGDFSSVSGINAEADSGNPCSNSNGTGHCSDYYSLQLNTNSFTCTPSGGHSTTCLEQFVYTGTATAGNIAVWWYLPGYHSTWGNCPTGFSQPPGFPNDCTDPTNAGVLHADSPKTKLGSMTLLGEANYEGSGDDVAQMCDGNGCYAATTTGSVLGTSSNWTITEFNVLGFGGGSQAQFNTGTSLTAEIFEYDHNGNMISPSCTTSIGTTFTAETANLALGTCTGVSPPLAHISFTESH